MIDLTPAVADLLHQLGAPYDNTRRLLVEAHPDRETEIRKALAELPEGIRDLVDLRFPADYPADSVAVRPVHLPQWHIVPATIAIPDPPAPTGPDLRNLGVTMAEASAGMERGAAMIRDAMALPYADREGYDPSWRP